jgi:hypothetical protein
VTKGFVLIEINTVGQARMNDNDEVNWVDFRLQDVLFHDAEGVEQLHGQLPEDLKDCKVLVVFDYVCNCSRDYWGEYDCEELFNIVNYTVVQDNYKEFYREQVTDVIGYDIGGLKSLDEMPDGDNYYKNLVADWEEFYDEDFVPFKKKPKRLEWF